MLVLEDQQPYHTASDVEAKRVHASNCAAAQAPSRCVLYYVVCECMAVTTHGHGPTSYGVAEILRTEQADACASRSAALAHE